MANYVFNPFTGALTPTPPASGLVPGIIVNADISASAAIAGTKVAPDFGSQTVITTGSGLIGTATSLTTLYSGAGKLQVASNDATTIQSYAFSSTGVDYSATLELSRARNTQASPTIVANGDYIGQINFAGYNTNFQRGATIYALVDGEPGTAGDTTDMPGKLVFATTPNGSATPTTRMSIDSAGAVTLAGTLDVPLGAAATPSITFTGDLNTGIYSPGADQLAVATNGVERVEFGPAEVVFNDGGENYDFRVEGDTNANLLFVDASADRIGIGTSSPGGLFHVSGGRTLLSSSDGYELAFARTGSFFYLYNDGGSGSGKLSLTTTAGAGGGEIITFTQDTKRVGIGTTSPNQLLQINSTSVDARLHITNSVTGSTNSDGFQIQVNNSDVLFHNLENGELIFQSNNTNRFRVDTSGRLLIGTSSSSSNGCTLQVRQNNGYAIEAFRSSNDSSGSFIWVTKSRGTEGSPTEVSNGDSLGGIAFRGYDGAAYVDAAYISAECDGTWTDGGDTTDNPSRLVFSTCPDSGSSPVERMRINSSGYLKASNSGAYDDATSTNHELRTNSATGATIIDANNNSYTGATQVNVCTRAADSAYSLFKGSSGDGGDLEFNLRGDGQAYADGSWNGGGADYAEYFEWSDLNPNAEDRRGISVVLDGNKIREAQADEDPIGVISGNPSVVGDAAWNKWSDKYLRDEFGTYIQEDYEVEDEDGNTVVQQRRKLNPAYDPDVEYVSREQRPEWDCVGLMGKLRIRKGQITGSRWIKMRDISDSVEEWLVR